LLAFDAGYEGSSALIRSLGMGGVIGLMAFSYLNARRVEIAASPATGEDDALVVGLQETG
jgi:hypothetical protein